ncbi:MAG: type II toxin-antitoxin system VapB family antitoxin [Gammaproteobacteria bacterium]|nr:type II toxin-antitoxin system VapB family antitoxin [Gammaproteobacteria bacterium]
MRTTVNLDDDLISEAQQLTGLSERSQLIREGLKALIEREAAKRLASLAGSEPDLESVQRRQTHGQ